MKAQVAKFSDADRRKQPRRIVNLAAHVRESGAATCVQIADLATGGCKIVTASDIEEKSQVWIKLPGLEVVCARVTWVKDGEAGCEFDRPLHAADLAIANGQAGAKRPKFHPGNRQPTFGQRFA
jgi:PilZ domain